MKLLAPRVATYLWNKLSAYHGVGCECTECVTNFFRSKYCTHKDTKGTRCLSCGKTIEDELTALAGQAKGEAI